MPIESIPVGTFTVFQYPQDTNYDTGVRNVTNGNSFNRFLQGSSEDSFIMTSGGEPGRGGMVYRPTGASANGGGSGVNFAGHSCFAFQFDCSSITSKPVSASLRLHAAANGVLTNIASDHKFVLAKATSNFINSAGGTSPPGTFGANAQEIEQYDGHTTDGSAYSLTEYATFNPADIDASGDVLLISLSSQALDDIASQDAFVFFILDKSYQADDNDPLTSAPSAGALTDVRINITGGGTGANVPRLIVDTSPFTNAENESGALVGGDFTINTFSSAVLGAQFAQAGEQVPFSLGTPGVRHLRGRTTAYATEKGEKVTDKDGRGKKGKSKR